MERLDRADRACRVDVLGFDAAERIVLAGIFDLSRRRTPRYEPHAGDDAQPAVVNGASPPAVVAIAEASGVGTDSATPEVRPPRPDVLLVDGADASSVARAKTLAAAQPVPAVPVVLVGDAHTHADKDPDTGWPVVARPLQWARLFRALDLAVGAPGFGGRSLRVAAAPSPTTEPDAPAAPVTADAARVIKVIPGAPWVLVVDDSAAIREFMKQTLAPLALNIDTADSGEKAIGMTAGRNYACIFLDVMLPGADGYQVCKLIKSKPTGHRAPVIMLTSRASPFDRIRGTMAGCDDYLAKPVAEDRLRTTVVQLVRRSRAAAAKRTTA